MTTTQFWILFSVCWTGFGLSTLKSSKEWKYPPPWLLARLTVVALWPIFEFEIYVFLPKNNTEK